MSERVKFSLDSKGVLLRAFIVTQHLRDVATAEVE